MSRFNNGKLKSGVYGIQNLVGQTYRHDPFSFVHVCFDRDRCFPLRTPKTPHWHGPHLSRPAALSVLESSVGLLCLCHAISDPLDFRIVYGCARKYGAPPVGASHSLLLRPPQSPKRFPLPALSGPTPKGQTGSYVHRLWPHDAPGASATG